MNAIATQMNPQEISRRVFDALTFRPPGPAIVMYHRVVELESDPWGLSVSPENFASQMRQLHRERVVLGMDEFVSLAQSRKLPRDAVAITFDDGYVDNLINAAPVLVAERIPATLFLASGPSLREELYWFEVLDAAILSAKDAVGIELSIDGERFDIEFGEREPADDSRLGWRAWMPARTEREAAFYRIWQQLLRKPPAVVRQTVAELRSTLPLEDQRVSGARAMTTDEVKALLSGGCFSLGGHTVDHPSLIDLSDSEALDQIASGKADAERLAGQTVSGFAFPYGRHDERVMHLAAAAGFRWACTTESRCVSAARDNLFALPRIAATDTPRLGLR